MTLYYTILHNITLCDTILHYIREVELELELELALEQVGGTG